MDIGLAIGLSIEIALAADMGITRLIVWRAGILHWQSHRHRKYRKSRMAIQISGGIARMRTCRICHGHGSVTAK